MNTISVLHVEVEAASGSVVGNLVIFGTPCGATLCAVPGVHVPGRDSGGGCDAASEQMKKVHVEVAGCEIERYKKIEKKKDWNLLCCGNQIQGTLRPL